MQRYWGDPATATQRLNFAQSFNGLAVFVAPIFGGKFILSGIEYTKEQTDAMSATNLALYLQSEADRGKNALPGIGPDNTYNCNYLLLYQITR